MENSQPHVYSKENHKSEKQMMETGAKKIDKHEKVKQKTTFTFQFIYAFGIVGVNVVVAVFIMTKIGMWFAKKYNNNSLILSFLIWGFIIGLYNAYRLMKIEKQKLDKEDIN